MLNERYCLDHTLMNDAYVGPHARMATLELKWKIFALDLATERSVAGAFVLRERQPVSPDERAIQFPAERGVPLKGHKYRVHAVNQHLCCLAL